MSDSVGLVLLLVLHFRWSPGSAPCGVPRYLHPNRRLVSVLYYQFPGYAADGNQYPMSNIQFTSFCLAKTSSAGTIKLRAHP